jgi:polar amino acid transport system substrate-binding protein
MDNFVGKIEQLMSHIGIEGYIYLGITILSIFFLIHIYSSRKEKKKLRDTINTYTNVFQKAFEISNDALLVLSENFEVMYANQSAVELLDLEGDYLEKILTPIPKIKRKREWETLDVCIEGKNEKEHLGIRKYPDSIIKNGKDKEIPINLFIDTVLSTREVNQKHTIVSMHNLTSAKISAEKEYKHHLTLLPNQLQAQKDFPSLYSKVHIENKKIALMLLHFDNFTRLRSILGYKQSDKMIVQFSTYLKNIVSELNISVYHTFDNHFLLTMSNIETLEQIENLAKDIQLKVATAYKLEDANLHLTVSIGISVYPDSGSTRQLLDHCYKALSTAQNGGDGKVELYIAEKNSNRFDELTLHNDMQKALDKGEFEVYYQPIVNAKTHEIVSAEALIRWIHPTLGFIPPDVFIGLMEKTGFIVKLGQYILEEVLKQQRRWQLFKFKQIGVSINVSMIEIATGEFVHHIEERLKYHQIDPALIKFEITEGLAMQNEGETARYFHALKKLGVSILLDDFGTGYTSFTYLKKFPADIVKIDKSLIDHILENEEDKQIVKAMIDLGHNLGMKIVVEGVENKEMVKILNSFGCDYIQGYYFSKPLPVFEFQKLLRAK